MLVRGRKHVPPRPLRLQCASENCRSRVPRERNRQKQCQETKKSLGVSSDNKLTFTRKKKPKNLTLGSTFRGCYEEEAAAEAAGEGEEEKDILGLIVEGEGSDSDDDEEE